MQYNSVMLNLHYSVTSLGKSTIVALLRKEENYGKRKNYGKHGHAGNVDHDVGRQSWCTDVHDGNVANRSYGTLGHPVL